MAIHTARSSRTAALVQAFTCGARSLLIALALTGTDVRAQSQSLTRSRDLLAIDPLELAGLLDQGRPAPVSEDFRARILGGLPKEGEVFNLTDDSRRKVAALAPVLRAAQRESVYAIKVIEVPQAIVAIHARTVVLISRVALDLLSGDELRALVAHEAGHEYVWPEYERASSEGDQARLQDLELVCDGIAIVMLLELRIEASRLITAIEKLTRFNLRFGKPINEARYPTVADRRTFARAP